MKVALLLMATATATATLAAAGCADNDLSLSVVQMQAITKMNNCQAMVALGTAVVGRDRGLLDVALTTTSGYIAVPVVRNNLQSRTQTGGVEFNSIQLLGANVTLQTTASGLSASQQKFFYGSAGGRVDPAMSAPMFIEALPAATAKALAPSIPAGGLLTVTAEIRPVGMRGGDQVVGGPVDFPIDLCNNCLLQVVGTCPLPKGTTVAAGGCFPQQDDPSTCCTDATGETLCGTAAPVTM